MVGRVVGMVHDKGLDPNVHLEKQTLSWKSVIASTQSSAAGTHPMIVVSDMPANDVNEWVMGRNLVMSKKVPAHEFCPKYLRYSGSKNCPTFRNLSVNC